MDRIPRYIRTYFTFTYFQLMDMNLKTKLPPKFVRVDLQNKVAMHSINNEINSEEIYKKINKCSKAGRNLNYNIIHEEIMQE